MLKHVRQVIVAAIIAASFAGVSFYVITTDPSYITQAAVTLYVDNGGNDSNACTASGASACLTEQGAVNKLPKFIAHPVIINTATNYTGTGAFVEGFTCMNGNNPVNGAFIKLTGALANVTPATGTATGTFTAVAAQSGNAFAVDTDNTQGWTVNNLRRDLLVTTGGTGSGQISAIAKNTATAITIAGGWPGTAPDTTTTYAVQLPSVTITSTLPFPIQAVSPESGASSAYNSGNMAAYVITGIRTGVGSSGVVASLDGTSSITSAASSAAPCVVIEKKSFLDGKRAIIVRDSVGVVARFNKFGGTGAVGVHVLDGSNVGVYANVTGVMTSGNVMNAMNSHVPSAVVSVGNSVEGGTLADSGGDGVSGSWYFRNDYIINSGSIDANIGVINISQTSGIVWINGVQIDGSTLGPCVLIGAARSAVSVGVGTVVFKDSVISNCATDGVKFLGPVRSYAYTGGITGTGSAGYGMRMAGGAQFRYDSATTVTGVAGDVVIDNRAYTWANISTVVGTNQVSAIDALGTGIVTSGSLPGAFQGYHQLAKAGTLAAGSCAVGFEGLLYLDSTANQVKVCDSNAVWQPIDTGGISTSIYSFSLFTNNIAINKDLQDVVLTNASTLQSLKFTPQVVGTNGGGSTIIFSLCNGAGACTTSFGSVTVNCTSAANTPVVGTVTTAAIPAGTDVNWRITTDGCTLDPLGDGAAAITQP